MLTAGRELDALVAEKVFGWVWEPSRNDAERMLVPPRGDQRRLWAALWDAEGRPEWLPHYSTDISDAWMVSAEMERRGFSCVVATNACSGGHQNGAKFYEGFRGLGHFIFDVEEHPGHHSVAESVPLAICRAALATIASTVDA